MYRAYGSAKVRELLAAPKKRVKRHVIASNITKPYKVSQERYYDDSKLTRLAVRDPEIMRGRFGYEKYLPKEKPMRVKEAVSLRAKDVYALMVDLSEGNPLKMIQADLAKRAGISRRWLVKILNELLKVSLITKSSEGKRNIYYL